MSRLQINFNIKKNFVTCCGKKSINSMEHRSTANYSGPLIFCISKGIILGAALVLTSFGKCIQDGTHDSFWCRYSLNFVFLYCISHLTNTLNLTLHSRVQVKKSDAVHKDTVSSWFRDKYSELKLIAKESKATNHLNPWKPEISFEKQSNAD